MESIDIDRLRELLLSESSDPDGPLEGFCQAWQNPRTMLEGDLQKYINIAKGTSGILGGHQVNWPQVQVLIEALRTKQYSTTIQTLLNTFSGEVFPVRMSGHGVKCTVCSKDIMFWQEWSETVKACPGLGEFENRNFLAYGTKTSRMCVCLDCLIQLRATRDLLYRLDPGILNYQKRIPGSLKP
jgi:hypothetical protein